MGIEFLHIILEHTSISLLIARVATNATMDIPERSVETKHLVSSLPCALYKLVGKQSRRSFAVGTARDYCYIHYVPVF